MKNERLELIAMVGIAINNNWDDSIKNLLPDSPKVCKDCVRFAEDYVFPISNGKIETDTVHIDVDKFAKKYVNSLISKYTVSYNTDSNKTDTVLFTIPCSDYWIILKNRYNLNINLSV